MKIWWCKRGHQSKFFKGFLNFRENISFSVSVFLNCHYIQMNVWICNLKSVLKLPWQLQQIQLGVVTKLRKPPNSPNLQAHLWVQSMQKTCPTHCAKNPTQVNSSACSLLWILSNWIKVEWSFLADNSEYSRVHSNGIPLHSRLSWRQILLTQDSL